LAEISPEVRLCEVTPNVDGRWYTITFDLRGTVPKPLVVPTFFVESARTQPNARRTLRNVLGAEVRMRQTQIAVDRSRQTLAESRPAPGPEPLCPRCGAAIEPGESLRSEKGETMHLGCGPG
jgi:hypothetical protein